MTEDGTKPEWYYVGHYGQLGPLTLEQMHDLVEDGVVGRDTYVWRSGMGDWSQAVETEELRARLGAGGPPPGPYGVREDGPPVFDPNRAVKGEATGEAGFGAVQGTQAGAVHRPYSPVDLNNYSMVPKSDKSRLAAGILNILPGFGRFYLGYAAHGVLQLLTSFCGVGFVWSWLDGLFIMVGGVKYDGYGRVIDD